ncbi:MAG: peptidase S10 [Alphaproteobacteria bacterium]|nr:peptidase S10 [Alphaproteobacteria bacterium]MDE2498644.1 peptidase S10 [Alphaproteobacteria bacterium]
MKYATLLIAAVLLAGVAAFAATSGKDADKQAVQPTKIDYFQPSEVKTSGTVRMGWSSIPYEAVAGTLVVHPKGWDDSASADNADKKDKSADDKNPTAKASMFYVAYFRKGASPGTRPITFLYNGGPGSSTVWLHMGAFGPKRVVTANDSHTPAAPYQLVDNQYSLLDASDLVFIDAPGTGFSRVTGKDKEKAFYGVDQDAHAFAAFIKQFLSKYQRWNSPKYLFGESYGTPRSAVLVNELETDDDIDFNGVILLSQILDFDLDVDDPENNPGSNLPYEVALPTYAATAWYHHKLPGTAPANLVPFLQNVEHFAMTDYARALTIGNSLDQKRRTEIANKLHQFTGLPVSYILKANLRIDGGEFEKNLQDSNDLTTGRLDTRFSGPTMDPLSKESDYDPQSAAISSAYVSAFNNYVRSDLNYGMGMTYRPEIELWQSWDFMHQPPGAHRPVPIATNVMPDLATAMKYNPDLKVMVNGGYFDLATPYYEGWYEMHHLPIPPSLQGNIQFHYYQSGHMVYANEASLKQLHDNVASFIKSTDNVK